MTGEQPWFIGDDAIISDLQDVWNHVYGRKVPFEIKKATVPFDLVSFLLSIYSFSFFSRPYKSFMSIEARLHIRPSVPCLATFMTGTRIRMIPKWMVLSLQSLQRDCWKTMTGLYSKEWKMNAGYAKIGQTKH